jgi:flagellar basal-body rod modification protein FlgD
MATSAIGNSLSSLYSTTLTRSSSATKSSASSTNSSSSTASSSSAGSSAIDSASKDLGKDAFLQLLVSQLKNQDPLNPMKDTEFISQLATFSSLEQMSSMNSSMTNLLQQQYYANNANMLGKQITTSDGLTGVVTKVTKEDSAMYLYVGTNKYSMSDIVSITSATTSTTT